MDNGFDSLWLLIVSSAVVVGGAALLTAALRRKMSSNDDWAVGGRSLPLYVVVGSQYATAMGGGMLVAHVGLGYEHGWSALSYGLIVSVALVLLSIAAPWLRRQGFTTLPDVFEKLYGPSRRLRAVVALTCTVVPFGWTCTQLVAFGKLFAPLTGLAPATLMGGMAFAALLFVLPAGLTSVAWSDFVFGCLMLLMSLVSGAYALNMAGGWPAVLASTPASIATMPDGLWAIGLPALGLWSLSLLPGTLTNQTYYQRIFAIARPSRARVSLMITTAVMLTANVWAAMVGLSLRAAQPGMAAEGAAGWFLTQLPSWFLAPYMGFIAATILSTIDSAVQSSTLNISSDIYRRVMAPDASEKTVLRLSRIVATAITALAFSLALLWPHALRWLVATYAYSASSLLVPVVVGYVQCWRRRPRPARASAVAAMAAGVVGCAVGQLCGLENLYAACGLAASGVGFGVVEALRRREAPVNRSATEDGGNGNADLDCWSKGSG